LENFSISVDIRRWIFAHFLFITEIFFNLFPYNGQFPIINGLFAAAHFAYFWRSAAKP